MNPAFWTVAAPALAVAALAGWLWLTHRVARLESRLESRLEAAKQRHPAGGHLVYGDPAHLKQGTILPNAMLRNDIGDTPWRR